MGRWTAETRLGRLAVSTHIRRDIILGLGEKAARNRNCNEKASKKMGGARYSSRFGCVDSQSGAGVGLLKPLSDTSGTRKTGEE